MLRLLLTLFLVIAAAVIYGYFQELNPGTVSIRTSPTTTFEFSPMALVLLSMAGGALIVILMVGIRETKHLIVNWQSTRLRQREEKINALHRDGARAFLSGRTADAIALFQKVLALDPNHADSLLWLGNTYQAEKAYTEAIRLHSKACSIDEHNIEILLELAKDLEGAKRYEEAQQVLKDILEQDPANLTALIRKRDLYIRLEQWSDALEIQHRLLKANLSEEDRRAESATLVGVTYETGRQLLERGHPEKARRYFRGAIKRDKNFLPAYMSLMEIVISEGKIKNAADMLKKVYAKTSNIIVLHRLEELYLEIGEPGEIIRAYQDAVQRDPQNPVLKFYLGKLYYRLEMIDEAFDLFSNLEAPRNQMPDYHKILADLYLRKQHTEQAVEELKKALGFRTLVVAPYYCSHCQHEAFEWWNRCRQCGQWNTCVARPWFNPSRPEPLGSEATPDTRPIPYQGIASPFETV